MISDSLDQEEFPGGQVTFHFHLPTGRGCKQVVCQLNFKKKSKQSLPRASKIGELLFKRASWNLSVFSSQVRKQNAASNNYEVQNIKGSKT